jgi:hypothetical protein
MPAGTRVGFRTRLRLAALALALWGAALLLLVDIDRLAAPS